MTQSVSESNTDHDAWSLGPQWAAVDWVLTDVDDTLTLHGRLPPQALLALAALREQGIEVIAVTGACAGWCDHIAHAWPVSAVIAENGAIVMQKVAGRLQLHSDRPLAEIREDQARLRAQIERILLDYSDLSLTLDQAYRLCEVAIDIGQNRPPVAAETVRQVLARIHALGAQATASSIHINAWYGAHSKRTTAMRYLKEQGLDEASIRRRVCHVGDSPNDQPLFEVLPLSVGVANIRRYWEVLSHRPAVVTPGEGGFGFAQFADQLLALKRT
jgi:HAD superfamily hydrolase (TIGR01484 family)